MHRAEESDFLRPMVRAVIQEFLEAEMAEAVGAEKGERIEGRLSYRSGYYTRSLVTRVGKLELRVPQDRNGRFSTEIFERYQRSEKALVAALTQMYIQGVSTRKVQAISEDSADTVSARVRSVRSTRSSMRSWAAARGGNSRASIPI
jgi:putative transposase